MNATMDCPYCYLETTPFVPQDTSREGTGSNVRAVLANLAQDMERMELGLRRLMAQR